MDLLNYVKQKQSGVHPKLISVGDGQTVLAFAAPQPPAPPPPEQFNLTLIDDNIAELEQQLAAAKEFRADVAAALDAK